MTRVAALLALALLCGCVRRPAAPAPGAHYTVGGGYRLAGTWFYPREDFHYDATGLASVLPERGGSTADGEAADGSAMTAAHQTLQLPTIARVTNLETGAQVLVRVNDRGPDTPARVIGLSRRAAALLGVVGVGLVRVEVDEGMSVALRDQLRGGPRIEVSAAPRGVVVSEALAPPPGVGVSARGRNAGVTRVADGGGAADAALVPERLPETVDRVAARPGQLLIRAGSFGQMGYARQVEARLNGIGARIERQREGRTERYTVIAGPFPSVAAADAALDQAMHAGVTDSRIVVE